MGKKIVLIILVMAILSANAPCMSLEDEEDINGGFPYAYVKDCCDAFLNVVKEPTTWERDDWLKVGKLAYITAGLFCLDEAIYEFVQDKRNDDTKRLAYLAEHLGDGKYVLPALGGLYLYGYSFNKPNTKEMALLAGESYIVAGVLVHGLKLVFHRHRPNSGSGPDKWEGPSLSTKSHSFPSGHSAVAFALATSLSEYNKDKKTILPYLAYGAATLTALSRIHDKAHWPSDVFVGSVLGYAVGKRLTSQQWRQEHKLLIRPNTSGGLGVSMGFTF